MKAAQLETKVYPAMSEEEAVVYRLALCDEATCASTVPHLIYAPVFSACYDSTVPNCDQLQFAHFAKCITFRYISRVRVRYVIVRECLIKGAFA